MSLYKRGAIWWVRFIAPDGRRLRRSTGTADNKAAQEYHDRLKVEHWRVKRFGARPRHSWQEAAVKWLKETPHKTTQDKDREILRWLDPYLGSKTVSAMCCRSSVAGSVRRWFVVTHI